MQEILFAVKWSTVAVIFANGIMATVGCFVWWASLIDKVSDTIRGQ